ncbi:Caspase domain [Popillia japonica]|uniref:Caspase domain n=1 Tax=Popillia japonica TaxID=7064 RepID=A0AAW1KQH7_POPJA
MEEENLINPAVSPVGVREIKLEIRPKKILSIPLNPPTNLSTTTPKSMKGIKYPLLYLAKTTSLQENGDPSTLNIKGNESPALNPNTFEPVLRSKEQKYTNRRIVDGRFGFREQVPKLIPLPENGEPSTLNTKGNDSSALNSNAIESVLESKERLFTNPLVSLLTEMANSISVSRQKSEEPRTLSANGNESLALNSNAAESGLKSKSANEEQMVLTESGLKSKSANEEQMVLSIFEYYKKQKKTPHMDIVVKKADTLIDGENDKVPVYKTISDNKRGNVLLINNISFEGTDRRDGSEVDVWNIKNLFQKMGFDIQCYTDLTSKNMRTIIESYSQNPILETGDIQVVVIMSHGNGNNETYIKTIDGHHVEIEWIVSQFSNNICVKLAGKPKIFIFQCCRGSRENWIEKIDGNVSYSTSGGQRATSDVLLAYATVSDFETNCVQDISETLSEICASNSNTPMEEENLTNPAVSPINVKEYILKFENVGNQIRNPPANLSTTTPKSMKGIKHRLDEKHNTRTETEAKEIQLKNKISHNFFPIRDQMDEHERFISQNGTNNKISPPSNIPPLQKRRLLNRSQKLRLKLEKWIATRNNEELFPLNTNRNQSPTLNSNAFESVLNSTEQKNSNTLNSNAFESVLNSTEQKNSNQRYSFEEDLEKTISLQENEELSTLNTKGNDSSALNSNAIESKNSNQRYSFEEDLEKTISLQENEEPSTLNTKGNDSSALNSNAIESVLNSTEQKNSNQRYSFEEDLAKTISLQENGELKEMQSKEQLFTNPLVSLLTGVANSISVSRRKSEEPCTPNVNGNKSLALNSNAAESGLESKSANEEQNVSSIFEYYKKQKKTPHMDIVVKKAFNFEGTDRRDGSEVDVWNIKNLFQKMGFDIQCYTDLTSKNMRTIIESYSQNPILETGDIQVVVIMSHGNGNKETYIKTIDGHHLKIEWIVSQFSNNICVKLAEKPKIFIFQCCRGSRENWIEKIDGNVSYSISGGQRATSDVLLAYATVSDYVSYRNHEFGSRFIRAICEIFPEHAHDTDIVDLLTLVDCKINHLWPSEFLQTCCVELRGFKKFERVQEMLLKSN